MKPITVMITGCGIYHTDLIKRLKHNEDNRDVKVIAANCERSNLVSGEADDVCILPRYNDKEYFDVLVAECQKRGVDIILPCVNGELESLSEHKVMLAEHGILASVSSPESLAVAHHKEKLAERFGQYMPKQCVAKTVADVDEFVQSVHFGAGNSVCCKITDGCGGRGFAVVNDEKAYDIATFNVFGGDRYITFGTLRYIVAKGKAQVLLQEYVEGTDYNVNALLDNGRPLYLCGYKSYVTSYGTPIKGEIFKSEDAYSITNDVARKISLDGNACFDFRIDASGRAWLLEINPRICATVGFVTEAGLNLPYYQCKRLIGEPIPMGVQPNYGLKMLRHYEYEFYED